MRRVVSACAALLWCAAGVAVEPASPDLRAPYAIAPGLFDAALPDLGLRPAAGTETVTIFRLGESGDHFSNGVVLIAFRNRLYAQWQSSAQDEDSPDTWVAYAVSDDGRTWSAPRVLMPPASPPAGSTAACIRAAAGGRTAGASSHI